MVNVKAFFGTDLARHGFAVDKFRSMSELSWCRRLNYTLGLYARVNLGYGLGGCIAGVASRFARER